MRGISIIGAVFGLLILAVFGASIVSLVGTDQDIRRRHIEKEQSFYEVQAGLEYAIREINQGGYPIVTNKQLGYGTFTNTIDYATHMVQTVGSSGDLGKTNQITYATMAGDCISISTSGANLTGVGRNELRGLTMRKACLTAITLDKMRFSWVTNLGEKVTQIVFDATTVYNNATGTVSGGLIEISDYTIAGTTVIPISLVLFTGNMQGKNITMTIYFTDSSYRSATFALP